MIVRVAFGAVALVLAVPAAAQDTPPPAAPADIDLAGDSVTLGAGMVYMPDYEGSGDYRFQAAPGAIGSISGIGFVVAGNRASVDLVPNRPGSAWDFQLGPIAALNFNRTSTRSIDDPRIRALGKVGTAIELGGYVGIGKTGVITSPYDKLSLSVSYRHDVAGAHDSGIIQPTLTYLTPLSRKAAVTVFASAEHAGRGYADAYFGITPAQSVASGLPVYNGRSGWKNWSLGGLGTVALTGDLLHGFKLVGGGLYRGMVGSYADSPVVRIAGSRGQWMGVVGLAYTF
ncbi:MipA/OmpV family protein [Sphingomonas sp.]|uniref:MipA/OmpV family protein n=1 Tax=Sphingomonas sp. TaxID=28214 RepID=UPI002CB20850|nr:MipA/OmpV family protein [Sphingomonas sp.]HWK34862.1 MipA/OmpV family protein [Sphingomonas sp.]